MPDSVAVIAAHPDDEILGCGGTIARLARNGASVNILLMTDGEGSRGYSREGDLASRQAARSSAAEKCVKYLGFNSVTQLSFPDNEMSGSILLSVVQAVEKFIERFTPKVVFTHHSGDVNVDHRITHDAVLAACRPQPGHCVKRILFFETPSSSEWNTPASRTSFVPNYFYDISDVLDKKLGALEIYRDEMRPFPHSRSIEGVNALARWRGASVGLAAAEAFMIGRIIE